MRTLTLACTCCFGMQDPKAWKLAFSVDPIAHSDRKAGMRAVAKDCYRPRPAGSLATPSALLPHLETGGADESFLGWSSGARTPARGGARSVLPSLPLPRKRARTASSIARYSRDSRNRAFSRRHPPRASRHDRLSRRCGREGACLAAPSGDQSGVEEGMFERGGAESLLNPVGRITPARDGGVAGHFASGVGRAGTINPDAEQDGGRPEANEREEQDEEDERFMRMALRFAEQARSEGEVPVGAVLTEAVSSGTGDQRRVRVVSTARNDVERRRDASAHAEMLCLQAASEVRQNWRLTGATLYVTMEPCPMCLSAAQLSRLDRIVFGAPSPNLGACGGWVDLAAQKHAFHDVQIRGGVLAEQCAVPLRAFFRSRRSPKHQQSPASGAPPACDEL